MAVGNYRGRISPLPKSKLNFKCNFAAVWTVLLTSIFTRGVYISCANKPSQMYVGQTVGHSAVTLYDVT